MRVPATILWWRRRSRASTGFIAITTRGSPNTDPSSVLPRRGRRLRPAGSDELRHPLFEDGQGNGTERQDGVVEVSLVELGAQLLLRFATMAADLHLTEFVGQRLAWPCDVALDLSRDLMFGQCRARAQEVH